MASSGAEDRHRIASAWWLIESLRNASDQGVEALALQVLHVALEAREDPLVEGVAHRLQLRLAHVRQRLLDLLLATPQQH